MYEFLCLPGGLRPLITPSIIILYHVENLPHYIPSTLFIDIHYWFYFSNLGQHFLIIGSIFPANFFHSPPTPHFEKASRFLFFASFITHVSQPYKSIFHTIVFKNDFFIILLILFEFLFFWWKLFFLAQLFVYFLAYFSRHLLLNYSSI